MTDSRGKAGKAASSDAAKLTPEQRRQVQREIDENLRRTYRESLEEDVPDRFVQLLAALRGKDGTS